MKPIDLYNRTPERTDKDINRLVGHIPELYDFYYIDNVKNTRVEISYYKDFCFDGRRTWTLAGVKLDGVFVMITQNAGREGDDHQKRFITDRKGYDELVDYVRELMVDDSDDLSCDNEVEMTDDVDGLVCFYNSHLDDDFKRY